MRQMFRKRLPEVMDDPAISDRDHAAALRSLDLTNQYLDVFKCMWNEVATSCAECQSLLDLGCGGGGLIGYVAQHLQKNQGMIVGLDISPRALSLAANWNRADLKWIAGDVVRLPFADRSIDMVTCSLVLHHFHEEQALLVLREAARVARRGVVVIDLTRSRVALVLTWLVTRLISRSRVFHIDGPRSVRSAFTPREMQRMAQLASLSGAQVKKKFPFRMVLTWQRDVSANG